MSPNIIKNAFARIMAIDFILRFILPSLSMCVFAMWKYGLCVPNEWQEQLHCSRIFHCQYLVFFFGIFVDFICDLKNNNFQFRLQRIALKMDQKKNKSIFSKRFSVVCVFGISMHIFQFSNFSFAHLIHARFNILSQ